MPQDGLCAVLAHEAAVGEVVPLQGLGELDDARQQGGAVGALEREEEQHLPGFLFGEWTLVELNLLSWRMEIVAFSRNTMCTESVI